MDVPMTVIECCVCHIQFAISSEHDRALQRCHNTFYCPKGHSQSYVGKSDIERVREERDKIQRSLNNARIELEKLKKKKCKKAKKR